MPSTSTSVFYKKMGNLQSEKEFQLAKISVARSHYLSECVEVTRTIFLWYFVLYTMFDCETSSTDESYHAEDDQDDSDSEDYSTLESDLYESEDQTFAPLSGGWACVVDVYLHI